MWYYSPQPYNWKKSKDAKDCLGRELLSDPHTKHYSMSMDDLSLGESSVRVYESHGIQELSKSKTSKNL